MSDAPYKLPLEAVTGRRDALFDADGEFVCDCNSSAIALALCAAVNAEARMRVALCAAVNTGARMREALKIIDFVAPVDGSGPTVTITMTTTELSFIRESISPQQESTDGKAKA